MPAQPSEVGQIYDLLIQTRDGSTLACRNKDGQPVNISQLAYMTTVDRQQSQHEETELQHKDQLVQLASSNLIDREFDQWPQISQGDWSGGMLQRVLTGGTPVTSFGPQSDPSRYWDGSGLLWPVVDYLPQTAFLADPVQDQGGSAMQAKFNIGVDAGGSSTQSPITFLYRSSGVDRLIVFDGANSPRTRTEVDDPAGTDVWLDMTRRFAVLWATTMSGTTLTIRELSVPGTLATITGTSGVTVKNGFGANGIIAAGTVGNSNYLAVSWSEATTFNCHVRLYSSNGLEIPQANSAIDLNVGAAAVTWMEFQGEQLLISLRLGGASTLISYSIVAQTYSTLFHAPNVTDMYFTPVSGAVFILCSNQFNSGTPPQGTIVTMYLLQGGSVQEIGALYPQDQGTSPILVTHHTAPNNYPPYAIFGVLAPTSPTLGTQQGIIYAYDVVRGRMFQVTHLRNLTSDLVWAGVRLGITQPIYTRFNGFNVRASWGVVAPTLGTAGTISPPFTFDTTNIQECYFTIQSGGAPFRPGLPLQQGTQIVSSIIDFTSAQTKLYREIVVEWGRPGLPADSGVSVQIEAWLDQDPSNLNTTPDFNSGLVANGVNGGVTGQTQLRLQINQIATKLVYRVTTVGPSVNLVAAVKLVSVIVRAATGWTRTMVLDLADNVIVNTKGAGDTCWRRQQILGQPAIDGVVAYNFLRQLWRIKGGLVAAAFPNQDGLANWLLQDLHFDSPKPYGVSMRGDQKSGLSYICTAKLREDV